MKYILAFLLILTSATTYSLELNYQAQYDESVAPPHEGANLLPAVDQQNWEVSVEEVYEKKLRYYGFFLRRNVLVKKELKVTNGQDTIYFFDENKYALVSSRDEPRSSTSGNISATSLSNRPTLFVLVPGAALDAPAGKYQDWGWFDDMEEKVQGFQDSHSSESVMMQVIWSSTFPNKSQVRQVSNRIKDFLNKYNQNKWDVVILGHSRGGIFTHELSQELRTDNIKHLVTILLDPTASQPMGDFYPTSKARNVKKGILYIDRESFVPTDILPTVSDRPIPGYDEYTIDACYGNTDTVCSHVRITRDYLKSHYFTNDMNYIAGLKQEGREKSQYTVMNTPWKNITTRDATVEHLLVDVGGAVENGNFHGYVTTPLGGGQIVAGQDGLSVGLAVVVVSADIIISKQGLQVGAKIPAVDATIGINDKDVARVKVSVAGIAEGDISLRKGGKLKFEAGPVKVGFGW